jgi:hypothetical protein
MPAPRTIALAVLAAGLTTACSSTGTPSTATSAPAPAASSPAAVSPSATATATLGDKGGDVLDGGRQVVIAPIPGGESILAVDDKGRLGPADGDVDKGLFVLTPANGKHQIRTAAPDPGGEASCLGVKQNGSDPLTVVATACDTSRAGQLFTIKPEKKKDSKGRPTYAISNQGAFLQVADGYGLIAEELGDSPLRTTYSLVDNGPATLPSLD